MIKLLALLFLLPALAQGQTTFPKDSTTGEIMYSQIVEVNKTKDQLFTDSKAWVSDAFKSYQGVIEVDDREAGKVIVKGETAVPSGPLDKKILTFRITIDSRDNKFRSIIDNVKTKWSVLGSKYIELPVSEMSQEDHEYKEVITYKDKKRKKPIPDAHYGRIQKDKVELKFIDSTLRDLEKSIKAKLSFVDDF